MTTNMHFLQGWINPDNMDNEGWFEHWKEKAIDLKKENSELVVFKIPYKNSLLKISDSEIIEAIELMLQNKFKI